MTWWWGYELPYAPPLPAFVVFSFLPLLLCPCFPSSPSPSSFILYHLQPSQNTPALSSSSFSLIQFIYGLKGGIRLWPSMTSAVLRPGVCERVFWMCVCTILMSPNVCTVFFASSCMCLNLWGVFIHVSWHVFTRLYCDCTGQLCVSRKRWQSGHWKEIQPLSFQVKTSSKSIKVQIPHLW